MCTVSSLVHIRLQLLHDLTNKNTTSKGDSVSREFPWKLGFFALLGDWGTIQEMNLSIHKKALPPSSYTIPDRLLSSEISWINWLVLVSHFATLYFATWEANQIRITSYLEGLSFEALSIQDFLILSDDLTTHELRCEALASNHSKGVWPNWGEHCRNSIIVYELPFVQWCLVCKMEASWSGGRFSKKDWAGGLVW